MTTISEQIRRFDAIDGTFYLINRPDGSLLGKAYSQADAELIAGAPMLKEIYSVLLEDNKFLDGQNKTLKAQVVLLREALKILAEVCDDGRISVNFIGDDPKLDAARAITRGYFMTIIGIARAAFDQTAGQIGGEK